MSEGFGIAVIEAMASRLPVIVSNVGPLPEILIDGNLYQASAARRGELSDPLLCQ